ncbi:MarR family winged helix-turn-helix transcriptional regulator [Aquibacillus saliphilus]|uniref:MarR family winged helix-turn-helix transcriptional regulator n=1 Tax=Aquibacillus saliphilus TaxID=1909422 RepID=UPI001CF00418|nr:MarR family transcriptional regulator [Aquibacillus saliphilus]
MRTSLKLCVTSGASTGIADKLESLDLIERQRSKVDRRVVTVVLSKKGENLVQDKKKNMLSYINTFCRIFLRKGY